MMAGLGPRPATMEWSRQTCACPVAPVGQSGRARGIIAGIVMPLVVAQ